MLNNVYVLLYDIFPNFNDYPCAHFSKILLQLSLTCKLFNELYGKIKQIFGCNICTYREIICEICIQNKIISCDKCRCKKRGISRNPTKHNEFYNGYCSKCFSTDDFCPIMPLPTMHSLGTGKTCAAIAVAEKYKKSMNINILV